MNGSHARNAHAARLLELSRRLDEPFEPRRHVIFITLMAIRSRSLFAAVMRCSDEETGAAVGSLLRGLVEANIAIRFVCERNTELLLELWEAEGERGRLSLDDRLRRLANKGSWHRPLLSAEERAAIEAHLRAAREAATDAGVRGVNPKGGAVFPGIASQVDELDSVQVIEAYAMAYGPLSSDVHLGAGAFDNVTAQEVGELIQISDAVPAEHLQAAQALAITMFASTLVMADLHRQLGIGSEIDEIKRQYIPHERPLGERQRTEVSQKPDPQEDPAA
jgi:hypothetical protein